MPKNGKLPLMQGRLTLVGDTNKMLFYPKDEEEKNLYKENYGWISPDYRQNMLQDAGKAIAKPEDFLPFMFRHISATIVGAGSWKATEFTEKVLREAVRNRLLDMKPSYVDHELEVGNIIGVVGESVYQNGFKANDGTLIPAGIIAPIWVDSVLHTDLCRKLSAYPVPHIQSVSITVAYEWEPSHEFTNRDGEPDMWEFECRVGTMVDGKMVRRIVTKIIDIYESSLVWLGADPIAKILDENNQPINVEKTAIVGKNQYNEDPLKQLYNQQSSTGTYFVYDTPLTKQNALDLRNDVLANFSKSGNSNIHILKNEDQMNKVVEIIAQKLGKKPEEVTEADVQGYDLVKTEEHNSLKEKAGKVDTLTNEKTELQNQVDVNKTTLEKYGKITPAEKLDELETSVGLANVVPMAEYGDAQLKSKREAAVKLYKLAVAEKDQSDAVIKTIESADKDAVEGFLKQYGAKTSEQFGGKCNKCGSEEISFRSSVDDDDPENGGKKEKKSGGHMAHDFRE